MAILPYDYIMNFTKIKPKVIVTDEVLCYNHIKCSKTANNQKVSVVMYTDTVVEFFVERKKGKKAILKYAGIGVVMAILLIALFMFSLIDGGSFFAVALVLAIGVVALGVFLIGRQNIENEYSFFSGELTLDRILNKSKRVPVVEFKLKDVDEMGLYEVGVTKLNDAALNFTSEEDANGGIYLRVPSSMIDAGKRVGLGANFTYIILENDERVKKAIKPYIRAGLYREAMKVIG